MRLAVAHRVTARGGTRCPVQGLTTRRFDPINRAQDVVGHHVMELRFIAGPVHIGVGELPQIQLLFTSPFIFTYWRSVR